jgi:hypothetical protein
MVGLVDELVTVLTSEVKRFAISNLAEVLYRNVEHDLPRADVDWLTAEIFIDRNLNPEELYSLTKQYLVLSLYESLRAERPDLPEIGYDFMVPGYPGYEDNSRTVSSVLSQLTKDKIRSLFLSQKGEEKTRRIELILGRHVWELYQELKKSELLIEGCYGKIIFQ